MALPPSGTTNEAFVREVDEEYRRDQMFHIWRKYGRWIVGVVVAALLGLALYIFLDYRSDAAAGKRGEEYDAAMLELEKSPDKAAPAIDKLAKSGTNGYAAAALLTQGNLLLEKRDTKGAAAKFAEIVNNASFEQPMRDLALIRQTAAEFDSLKPEQVIDRLKGLASPTSVWFGSAGEMTAAAMLKQGKRAEAGALLSQIAQGGDNVPESIRLRAAQLAGSLGVDASPSQENKAQ